jgi:hypothetical protein
MSPEDLAYEDGLADATAAAEREAKQLRSALVEVQRQRDAARDHATRITKAFDALYNDALDCAVPGHSTVQTPLLEALRKAVRP